MRGARKRTGRRQGAQADRLYGPLNGSASLHLQVNRITVSGFKSIRTLDRFELIDVLFDPAARLLVADSNEGRSATVGLAHEALISEWRTARGYVEENAGALRIRRTLEDRYARWRALGSGQVDGSQQFDGSRRVDGDLQSGSRGGRIDSNAQRAGEARVVSFVRRILGKEPGLLGDADLNDARRMLRDYREELGGSLVAYIEKSIEADQRRRNAAIRAVAAVAVVMTILAVGAAYEARIATEQREVARSETTTATRTAQFLVSVFKNANPEENHGSVITARSGWICRRHRVSNKNSFESGGGFAEEAADDGIITHHKELQRQTLGDGFCQSGLPVSRWTNK